MAPSRADSSMRRWPNTPQSGVYDAGDAWPVLREAESDAEAGRGLVLVDVLTESRWGVSTRGGIGKLTWAVVTADGSASHVQN